MAITKEHKKELLDQYQSWLEKSQAVLLVEYTGVTMKDLDAIRAKVRESGGEFHVIKNTLARKAFETFGIALPEGYFEKSTAAAFAFSDVAATAKALNDAGKTIEVLKVKGGFIEKQPLNTAQVKALATLPPLPIVRSQLLGVLSAPAGKLVRTLAEPARQVAAVIKAYSEKSAPTAA